MERLNRRSFMKIAGAATGAAAIAAAPPIARAAIGDGTEKIDATTDVPHEPVVAYVRDALGFVCGCLVRDAGHRGPRSVRVPSVPIS